MDVLLERDYDVRAVVRSTSRLRWLEGKPVERIAADFTRPVSFPPCDVFFHAAGVIRAGSYEEFLAGNRDAAVRAFEGVHARRFVLVSSLAVAGPGGGIDETTPCEPVSLYGKSKWEGEQEIWRRRDRMPVTVIRPPVVYGPRDSGLYELYRLVALGLRPDIGMSLSLVHVRDLAEGIVRSAETPAAANEVFFMANPGAHTAAELLDAVADGLGRRVVRFPVPARVIRFLGAVSEDVSEFLGRRAVFGRDKAVEMTQKEWSCASGKARKLLGWEAKIPLARGMEETVAWYRSEGLL